MIRNEYVLSEADANVIKTALGFDPFYDKVKIDSDTIQLYLDNGVDIEAQAQTHLGDTIANLYTPEVELTNVEERSQLVSYSGRWYLYSDSRWVTESDDNYGSGYFQFTESGGTGSNPVYEWEHMGTLVPAGKIIKSLMLGCRANSTSITDIEFRIVCKTPAGSNTWYSGIDNDSEIQVQTLYDGRFVTPEMSGNMGDTRLRKIDLNNFEVQDDCQLCIYIKPIRYGSGTKYLYSNWTWEIV